MTMKDYVQVIVLWAIAAVGLVFVWRSRAIHRKRQAVAIVMVVALLASFGVGMISFESLLGSFPSLEAVYEFRNPDVNMERATIIKGETSVMAVIPDPSQAYEKVEIYYETDNGWKVGDQKDTEPEWETYVKESVTTIQMFQCRETGERFLYIVSISNQPLELADSQFSEFEEKDGQYYACIGTVKKGYSLEVNGTQVMIPKISSK